MFEKGTDLMFKFFCFLFGLRRRFKNVAETFTSNGPRMFVKMLFWLEKCLDQGREVKTQIDLHEYHLFLP